MTALKPKPKHYIREHREAAELTLRDMAERLTDDTGEPVISYASLSRIEAGLQPYSQPILEALAEELNTTPADLLSRDPQEPQRDQKLGEIRASLDQAQAEIDKAREMIAALCEQATK